MQPTCKHVPPNLSSFSMIAVFRPNWPARIAATYPPGPLPITTRSYWGASAKTTPPSEVARVHYFGCSEPQIVILYDEKWPHKRGLALPSDSHWAWMRSFGVRQLAAAFLLASLLVGIFNSSPNSSQQAGWWKSGSKLQHCKAPHAGTSGRGPALSPRFSLDKLNYSY